jgi:hypothetical protein
VTPLSAWCAKCRTLVIPQPDGRCAWCDTPTGLVDHDREPQRRGGGPRAITPELLIEARDLYATGLSIRQVAALILPRTTYRSAASCAESLYSMFAVRGWRLRPQREVTSARNYRHGRASNAQQARHDSDYAAYRREQRIANGDQHGRRCAGHKQQPPGRGQRCSRPALNDSDYCQSHDPRRRAANARRLVDARQRGAADRAARLRQGDERLQRIIELRAQGWTWLAIAIELGYRDASGPHRLWKLRTRQREQVAA